MKNQLHVNLKKEELKLDKKDRNCAIEQKLQRGKIMKAIWLCLITVQAIMYL